MISAYSGYDTNKITTLSTEEFTRPTQPYQVQIPILSTLNFSDIKFQGYSTKVWRIGAVARKGRVAGP